MPQPEITVGTLATATRDSGVCRAGEVGVCYEVYQLGNRSGYGIAGWVVTKLLTRIKATPNTARTRPGDVV